jgi:NAD-dependent deacetylase
MKKLVFFTGAGISQASGIPTYRDPDNGIWEKYDVMEVCSSQGWKKNPNKVLEFFNEVRELTKNCLPNEAHKLIADLEKDFDVTVITQNVDDLHEQAGSTDVIHIHGKLNESINTLYGYKPNVVLYGEDLHDWDIAIKITKSADIFVIIGTSLEVYPASTIVEYTNTSHKFFIDPSPKNFSAYTLIPMEAIDGMKHLNTLIEK